MLPIKPIDYFCFVPSAAATGNRFEDIAQQLKKIKVTTPVFLILKEKTRQGISLNDGSSCNHLNTLVSDDGTCLNCGTMAFSVAGGTNGNR